MNAVDSGLPLAVPPTIAVITVCRNARSTVERTIQSVLWQDYPHIEYWVVDGLSTDGTWELVARYRDRLAGLVHEADNGIYDAMNKGLRLSAGEVLCFLNADDYLVSPYALSRVAAAFAAHPEVDIVYTDYLTDTGAETIVVRQPDRLGRGYFLLVDPSVMHQSMFCRRRAFDRVGPFNHAVYRVAADKDWNVRAFLVARLPSLHLPLIAVTSTQGGYSTTAKVRLEAEKALITRTYFGPGERLYRQLWLLARRARRRLRTGDFSLPRSLRGRGEG